MELAQYKFHLIIIIICTVISCPCYISSCYIKQTILNAEVSFLTKIDFSNRFADFFLVI